MAETEHCLNCGATLAADSLEGYCLKCLFIAALSRVDVEPMDAWRGGFGDYEALELIARGGMGVVFRARQRALNRIVALKLISAGPLASDELLRRFRNEAETVASLNHPNIVPIYEIGEQDGYQYFSMKLIDGPSLDQRLRGGPLSNREAARIIAAVGRAIHHAHLHGILHRDLKPANILIQSDGQPCVTDFGLAKAVESDSKLTRTLATLGTPSYISPEQARGETRNVTTASDVYGLGAVLYETLSGSPPFVGETSVEIIQQVLHREPRKPTALNPNCDRDLETVCLKCLEKEPSRRYQSALEAVEDIERWLRGEPIQARPAGGIERAVKWMNRHPAFCLFAALLLLTVAIGVTGIFQQWRKAEHQRVIAERARSASEAENYRASVGLAHGLIERGDIEAARKTLFSLPESLRNWEWGWLIAQCHQEAFSVDAFAHGDPDGRISIRVPRLHFSADGARLAAWAGPEVAIFSASDGSLIHRMDVPGYAERRRAVEWVGFLPKSDFFVANRYRVNSAVNLMTGVDCQLPGGMWGCFPDREGRGVWMVGFDAITLFDFRSTNVLKTIPKKFGAALDPFLSPDGRTLMTARRISPQKTHSFVNPEIEIWDLESGILRHIVKPPLGEASRAEHLVVDATGSSYAIAGSDGSVSVYDILGQHRFTLPKDNLAAGDSREIQIDLEVRAGPRWLLIRTPDLRLQVRSAETGAEVLRVDERTYAWDVSPDGNYIVTLGGDWVAQVRRIRDGRVMRTLAGHRDIVQDAKFSPDGRSIATIGSSGQIKIWNGLRERERFELDWDRAFIQQTISPDGTRLATTHSDRAVRVWDVESRKLIGTLRGHFQWVFGVAWSADGRKLATASVDRRVVLWDVESARIERVFVGLRGIGETVVFPPETNLLAVASSDGALRIWDIPTGSLKQEMTGEPGEESSVAWSPDGNWIAASSMEKPLRVVDASTHKVIIESGPAKALAWSPDSRRLTTATDRGVKVAVWDVAQRRLLYESPGRGWIRRLTYSPDGARLFIARTEPMVDFGRPVLEVADAQALDHRVLIAFDMRGALLNFMAGPTNERFLLAAGGPFASTWEAFPWNAPGYPGGPDLALPEKVEDYARRYWKERERVEESVPKPLPDRPLELDRSLWAPRDSSAPPETIDLTSAYNGWLNVCWAIVQNTGSFIDYSYIPPGVWSAEKPPVAAFRPMPGVPNVPYDIRGLVVVGGRKDYSLELRPFYPRSVRGIQIQRKAAVLHFLHGTTRFSGSAVVGNYILHYEDGSQAVIPMLSRDSSPEATITSWLDRSSINQTQRLWDYDPSQAPGAAVHTYAWTNSAPDKKILTMDIESAYSGDDSFLMALTVK